MIAQIKNDSICEIKDLFSKYKYISMTYSNKKSIENKLQVYSHIALINTVQTIFSIPVLAPPKVIKNSYMGCDALLRN